MSIPSPFLHLVDDAAIFPPGLAPVPEAVRAHIAHLASAHADLVGPLIVDTARLDELISLAPAGLSISVVVSSAAEIDAAVERTSAAGLHLAGLEVKLVPGRPATAQIDQVAVTAASLPTGTSTYIEAPRPSAPSWPATLAAVSERGLRLKFRTGGTAAAAFPDEAAVAAWIDAAVNARTPFKCTAGLHNAVRHTGHETGFEHHGYLNVLLATAHAVAGDSLEALTEALGQRDPQRLVAALKDLADGQLALARRSFTSYGSCSILEPLEDLTELHLLTR